MTENTTPDTLSEISAEEQTRIISEYRHKSKHLPKIIAGCVAVVCLALGLAYILPMPYLTSGDAFLFGVVFLILIFNASIFFYYRCPRCRAPLPTKGIGVSAGNNANCPKCRVRLK